MTQKEINELTIFLGNESAFIGKALKNGQPSKVRRILSEQEIMSFATWFIRICCKKYGMNELVLNVDNVPTYKIGIFQKDEKEPEINVKITKA